MKTPLVLFVFTASLFAQAKTEICVRRTDIAGKITESCQMIPAPILIAVGSFLATQVIETGQDAQGRPITAPKYRGPADLLFTHLRLSLFAPLLDLYPPAAVSTAKAQVDAASSALATAKAAALPVVPATEP